MNSNNTPSSYFTEVNNEYKNRRDVLYNELIKVKGVICKKPAGAFYIVAKLPIENAEDLLYGCLLILIKMEKPLWRVLLKTFMLPLGLAEMK